MAKKLTTSQVVAWCKKNNVVIDVAENWIDILIPAGRRWGYSAANDPMHVYVSEWSSAEEKREVLEDLAWYIADGLVTCDCEQCS